MFSDLPAQSIIASHKQTTNTQKEKEIKQSISATFSTGIRKVHCQNNFRNNNPTKGVNKFFKTLAKLASSLVFSLAKSENNWPKIYKG
jgi:hypothetical protein